MHILYTTFHKSSHNFFIWSLDSLGPRLMQSPDWGNNEWKNEGWRTCCFTYSVQHSPIQATKVSHLWTIIRQSDSLTHYESVSLQLIYNRELNVISLNCAPQTCNKILITVTGFISASHADTLGSRYLANDILPQCIPGLRLNRCNMQSNRKYCTLLKLAAI